MAIYAKFTDIAGGSLHVDRKDWSDILSVEWGAGRSDPASGKTRRAGNARIDDFILTLLYDKAAPLLQANCLKGKVVPKVEVELTGEIGGSDKTYLRYELKNATFNGYQTNAEADDDMPPVVILSSRFTEMKVIYTEYGQDGSQTGTIECKYKARK